MRKVLLGTSGGTAAAMGAMAEYFVSYDFFNSTDIEIYLIPETWKTMAGLTRQELTLATPKMVYNWDKMGGAPMLPSCKDTNVFKIKQEDGTTVDMSDVVRKFCSGYEGIIPIGGGGTTMQSAALHEAQNMNFIVPLATMDNDIQCFDEVLGYRTAFEKAAASITACVNDAMTMNRPTMIFCMGYECGRLSVAATDYARSKYGAKIDMLHIPETNVAIEDVASKIRRAYKSNLTIVISEGVCKVSDGSNDGMHKHFSTADYAKKIMELTGINFKVLTPDYVQRSGAPTESDRKLASNFAVEAACLVNAKKWNYVIGSINGTVCSKPLEEVVEVLENQKPTMDWYNTKRVSLDGVNDILIR